VIVDDLDVFGACIGPGETDPPLIVDPDTVLALTVTTQCLQSIAWWCPHVVEGYSSIEDREFP
jgi:hypothetical protein